MKLIVITIDIYGVQTRSVDFLFHDLGSISSCTISTPLQGMLAFINPTTGYTSLYLFIGRSCGSIYHKLCFATTNWHMGGFLTRRSSAIRRFFTGFLMRNPPLDGEDQLEVMPRQRTFCTNQTSRTIHIRGLKSYIFYG